MTNLTRVTQRVNSLGERSKIQKNEMPQLNSALIDKANAANQYMAAQSRTMAEALTFF